MALQNLEMCTSSIVVLNECEFLVLVNNIDLMKYNTIEREWTLFFYLEEAWEVGVHSHIMIDRQQNRLYAYSDTKSFTLDLPTRSISENDSKPRMDNDKLEFPVAKMNHVIWNQCPWPEENFVPSLCVYIRSKKIILMLGGTSFDLGGHGSNEPIW